jgi:hypothetical protein
MGGEKVYRMYGYGIIPHVHYYPFSKNMPAPLGLFIGSAFRFAAMQEEYMLDEIYSRGNSYSLGVCAGYKLRYKQLLVEALIGYGRGISSGFDEQDRANIDPIYLHKGSHAYNLRVMKEFPRLELSIGFVFPKVKVEKRTATK